MTLNDPSKARAVRLLSLYLFLAVAILLQGCSKPAEPALVFDGETMGTYYQVKIVAAEEQSADELRQITEQALADVNNKMSTYIPNSELMRLASAPLNTWVEVSEPLFSVLRTSAEVSQMSGGAFDITVGPLVDLWGFGPQGVGEPPSDEDIEKILQTIGHRHLRLEPDTLQVMRTEDVKLDLSAVAKGYGADYLAEVYQKRGLNNFMVEIGGELRLSGHSPSGRPWRIGVEVPSLTRTGVIQAVEVTDAGMATSGDYRNYYEVEGQRVSHTIDPSTGRPITHNLASVTIIAPTAAQADALATALNVMGAERARTLAEKEGIAAYFIERVGDEFVLSHTKAFEQYVP